MGIISTKLAYISIHSIYAAIVLAVALTPSDLRMREHYIITGIPKRSYTVTAFEQLKLMAIFALIAGYLCTKNQYLKKMLASKINGMVYGFLCSGNQQINANMVNYFNTFYDD